MVFIDTNIFVYAHDESDLRKTKIARDLLVSLSNTKTGCISTQVVQEFCNATLKKSILPLKAEDARRIIRELLEPLLAHGPDALFYIRALELYDRHSLSFYDALIVQAAIDTNCQILYSEDLQDGQSFGKLVVKNPFKA